MSAVSVSRASRARIVVTSRRAVAVMELEDGREARRPRYRVGSTVEYHGAMYARRRGSAACVLRVRADVPAPYVLEFLEDGYRGIAEESELSGG